MGNNKSTNKKDEGKEMSNSENFAKVQDQEPLPTLENLSLECSELQEMVEELSEAIEEIFEDRDEQDESAMKMESNLQTKTKNIQQHIHHLHKNLESHSKLVSVGNNLQVMSLVKILVSIVNDYINMLLRNIRKLRRSLEEKDLGGEKVLNLRSQRKGMSEQVDIIPEQLDVDAMLMELEQTEEMREGLERDIVSVLAIWFDYRELVGELEGNPIDQVIEKTIRESAPAVTITNSHGVFRVKKPNEKM